MKIRICLLMLLFVVACGDSGEKKDQKTEPLNVIPFGDDYPEAGNPDGDCEVPLDAGLEDVSTPDTVIGDGTPASCTSEAVVTAVKGGGVITFNCGNEPVVIEMEETAKVVNSSITEENPRIVIDGGSKVALSGKGERRILYMNTCDRDQDWTTPECNNQDHPHLTVQNITFMDGNSKGETEYDGGGAIWVRGGRFKAVNCRFFNNACADQGPDVGGAGIRVFDMYDDQPAYLANCTFGGSDELMNVCSNGGGISSIGVSWSIYNSLFSHNQAIGCCGNPARDGTAGGGSGGAIYNDGNTMTLHLCGTKITQNAVEAHGAGIFFVSNDMSGNIILEKSVIENNIGGSWYALPDISMHDNTRVDIDESTVLTPE